MSERRAFRRVRLIAVPVLLLAASIAGPAATDDGPKGHAAVQLLGDMNSLALIVDAEPLGAWLKPIVEAAEARFPLVENRQALVVQVTIHHDAPPTIDIAGAPAPVAEDVKAIEAAIDKEAFRAKRAALSLRIVVKDKEGDPADLPPLSPELKTPREQLLQRVADAPSAEGLSLLKRWATDEALPLLAATAEGVDEKFAGVRHLGAAISKTLADPKGDLSVEKLATANPDFWRATLEMARGEPLTPAVEMALLLANGRVQWAEQIATMAGIFDGHRSGPSDLLGYGKALASAYLTGQNRRIQAGIELYDAGKLDEALGAFDAILKDDPQSAWALYERFHTARTIHMNKSGDPASADWAQTRAKILASFPMYQSMAEASGAEGLFDLLRRTKLNELFQEGRPLAKDVVEYADIALDLGAFDMAALMYWSILKAIPPDDYDNRPLLESFLYALDQLGVEDLKDNFKGDHEAAFAAIKADRRKRVKEALNPAKEP